ncbi:phthiocerol/phthiodiolone dimycocerosyl transferase family protein [Nocardia arthritidis]|nr:hypothetical protein [Nocardia arthritidis]
MCSDSIVRPLAPTEAAFVQMGGFTGYSLIVDGPLDQGCLRLAFQLLRRSIPILATRLRSEGDEYLLVASGDAAEITTVRGDIDQPLAGSEMDPARALAGLHLVRDGDRTSVTLLTHHGIADAHHSLAIFDELWSLYTDLYESTRVGLENHCYPESLEQVLTDRGFPAAGGGASVRSTGTVLPISDKPAIFAHHRFESDATDRMLAYVRQHGLTVNGLISAAILRAESTRRGVAVSEIVYLYAADLRHRLVPPVAVLGGTTMLGTVLFQARSDRADLADLARDITDRGTADLSDGTVQRRARIPGLPPELEQTSYPIVNSSNWGRIPEFRLPVELVALEFRPAAFCPPVRMPVPPFYVITGFAGRLGIHIGANDPVELLFAQQKLAAVAAELGGITGT